KSPGTVPRSQRAMNPTDLVDRPRLRDDIPAFGPGDTVKVHVRVVEGNRERIQVFQGAVIRRQGSGVRETFTARKVSFGVGVERTFPVHSPIVAKAFFIPSGSMIPELEIGDRVVVSKLSYRLHEPRRGDIVVFDCPPRASCPPPARPASPPVRGIRSLLEAIGVRQPSTEEYIK